MTATPTLQDRPLKVLFLASYFPKPQNPAMGPWALAQAQAFRSLGMDVRVVSLTSWVPRFLACSQRARSFALCPEHHDWDGLLVDYTRWLFYQVWPLRTWGYQSPRWPLALGWASAARTLARHVKAWSPDVVYAHHSCVNGYVAHRLKQRFGIPYVVTDHDFGEIRDCERFLGRRRILDQVSSEAYQMVAVASSMEADLRRLFPNTRVSTIHNGVAPIPADVLARPRPDHLANRDVVFSAGIFYERKGFPLLVEAFSRVASRHPRAVLRIAGDGPERGRIEAAVRGIGIGDRVELLGMLPREAVLQELAWCDAFALVGWNEPFATVFIEAAAAAKPIVLAQDGGFMDVFREGVHGYSVPPHDCAAAAQALDRVLSDPLVRARMGSAAQELWRSRLTLEANAHRYAKLFEAAIGVIPEATTGSPFGHSA